MEEIHSHDDIFSIAENLLNVLREPILIEKSKTVSVSGSIGIALFPEDARDMETLMHCADEAMYAVKEAGKDHYILYGDKDNSGQR